MKLKEEQILTQGSEECVSADISRRRDTDEWPFQWTAYTLERAASGVQRRQTL